MRTLTTCVWLLLLPALPLQSSTAQDASNVRCDDEVHTIARMAVATSRTVLSTEMRNVGKSYPADLVYAARSFELQPSDHNTAELLLDTLPKNNAQQVALMTLGDSLCDGESVAEMKSLSRLAERLSHDFAKAALRVPEMLPRYIAYASTSVRDPHSDYAVQMQVVCRRKHSEFIKVVNGFPNDQRDSFVKNVFDPESCRARVVPEAE